MVLVCPITVTAGVTAAPSWSATQVMVVWRGIFRLLSDCWSSVSTVCVHTAVSELMQCCPLWIVNCIFYQCGGDDLSMQVFDQDRANSVETCWLVSYSCVCSVWLDLCTESEEKQVLIEIQPVVQLLDMLGRMHLNHTTTSEFLPNACSGLFCIDSESKFQIQIKNRIESACQILILEILRKSQLETSSDFLWLSLYTRIVSRGHGLSSAGLHGLASSAAAGLEGDELETLTFIGFLFRLDFHIGCACAHICVRWWYVHLHVFMYLKLVRNLPIPQSTSFLWPTVQCTANWKFACLHFLSDCLFASVSACFFY